MISITKTTAPKAKPDWNNLGFGKIFTDHMFIMDYTEGQGWHDARIIPYGNIEVSPAAKVFHYGQAVFEGMKAFKSADGTVRVFRPYKNWERLNASNDRLCIPHVDPDMMMEGLRQLLLLDKDWIPQVEGTSLYIRPFVIATDGYLGVAPSTEYKFIIILSPSGAYYAHGLKPVRIYVESKYVRAVKGGTGMAKTGGNYAASLKSQVEAHEFGYEQILWLDGVERKYIEEVGAMNVFFVIDGTVVTPELNGSILPGITRRSVVELIASWGIPVEERRISIDEIEQAYKAGKLQEVFGTGTAAVISPVGELRYKDDVMSINDNKIGPIAARVYETITGLQYGKVEDTNGWMKEIK